MTIINSTDCKIYLCQLPDNREPRQKCESDAKQMIIEQIFGANAEIGHYADGAPYIKGVEDICISISHSATTCAIAVGNDGNPIGIDIESGRQQLRRVASRFLSSTEVQRFERACDEDRQMDFLLHCWTAKEAIYKAARTPGLGLTEIETTDDFQTATSRKQTYALSYHSLNNNELICTAAIKTDI